MNGMDSRRRVRLWCLAVRPTWVRCSRLLTWPVCKTCTNKLYVQYHLQNGVWSVKQSPARVSFCIPYPNRGKVRACMHTGTRTRTRRIWSLPAVEPRIFLGLVLGLTVCWYRLWVPLRVPTTPSTYCALWGRRCAKTRGRVRTWKFTIRTRTRALISLPVPAPWSAVSGTGTGKQRIGYPCMTLVWSRRKSSSISIYKLVLVLVISCCSMHFVNRSTKFTYGQSINTSELWF
jgi:hypothetical protein